MAPYLYIYMIINLAIYNLGTNINILWICYMNVYIFPASLNLLLNYYIYTYYYCVCIYSLSKFVEFQNLFKNKNIVK